MIDVSDLIGVKYTPHGRSKEEGFDCYGGAIEVLRRAGYEMRDFYYEQSIGNGTLYCSLLEGIPNIKLEKPEPYCIIGFVLRGKISHCGVYLGQNKFITASLGVGVHVDSLLSWKKRVAGYYKVTNTNIR